MLADPNDESPANVDAAVSKLIQTFNINSVVPTSNQESLLPLFMLQMDLHLKRKI